MTKHQQTPASFLERLIFNNRPAVILICLLISLFLFYQAAQVRPQTSFEKMIPLGHPYIQKMLEHRNDLANLGNTVRISVEATEGDIFSNTAGAASSSGGIAVNGIAALTDVTFTLNSAGTGGAGGANFGSTAVLTGGAFISNTAAFAGGGAYFNGAAVVSGTRFAGNTATANRGSGAYFNCRASAAAPGPRITGVFAACASVWRTVMAVVSRPESLKSASAPGA